MSANSPVREMLRLTLHAELASAFPDCEIDTIVLGDSVNLGLRKFGGDLFVPYIFIVSIFDDVVRITEELPVGEVLTSDPDCVKKVLRIVHEYADDKIERCRASKKQ